MICIIWKNKLVNYIWKHIQSYAPEIHTADGICRCTKTCNGKGIAHGNGACKRVTVATFQSGTIIITGANNQKQLQEVFHFVCDVYKKEKPFIEKKIHMLPPPKLQEDVEYIISKCAL